MARFIFMNKDMPLAELDILNRQVVITRILNNFPPFTKNINDWIRSRTSPVGRNNINLLLKQAQISNEAEFLTVTRSISFNDTFWVNDLDSPTTWDKVSPYSNRLSRIISEMALNCNYYGGELRSPSPEYRLDGSVDKCWKRINGEIMLFKTDGERYTSLAGLRPYAEYYAAQVAEQLGISRYVEYKINVTKTNNGYLKPYVYCKSFTNENYGYIQIAHTPMWDMDLKQLYSNIDKRSKLTLREMLLLDSIIVNFDRHGGNYGFLYNTDTFELNTLAPIFDNDCSLGALLSIQNKTVKFAYTELIQSRQPKTDLGGYIAQAKMSLTDKLKSNMKNMYPFHFERLPEEIDVEDERIKFMEYIVNSQIQEILK